jgi:hypothetical protein
MGDERGWHKGENALCCPQCRAHPFPKPSPTQRYQASTTSASTAPHEMVSALADWILHLKALTHGAAPGSVPDVGAARLFASGK